MKETDLQKQIVQWINLSGGYAWRMNVGSFPLMGKNGKQRWFRAGVKGMADILGVWEGRMLACEVKVGRNKPTPQQKDFLEEIHNRGGIAFVAYSLDDTINELKGKNTSL